MLFLRDGTTGPQDVPPGIYRYEVSGRGIVSVGGEVAVVPGEPLVLEVTVETAPESGDESPRAGRGGGDGGEESPRGRRGR